MSKYFKSKKLPSNVPATPPREMTEIHKEYAELKVKLADAQYLVYVYGLEVDQISRRMLEVNQEANARQTLDAEREKLITEES